MVELEQRRIHLEPAQVDPGGLWASGWSVVLSGKPKLLAVGIGVNNKGEKITVNSSSNSIFKSDILLCIFYKRQLKRNVNCSKSP